MPGLDKNRKRNQTICFRATPEERRRIEARIKASGLMKSEYYRRTFLQQQISIKVGKYESDRLSLEFKRLRMRLDQLNTDSDLGEIRETILDCMALLDEMQKITKGNADQM